MSDVSPPQKSNFRLPQWLGLAVPLLLGAVLRLINIDGKLPWTEELTAIAVSLGNSYDTVPLDRMITARELLLPLVPTDRLDLFGAMAQAWEQKHQPPLYFGLLHGWMHLFAPIAGLASIWAARALSAIIGTIAIGVIYAFSYAIFQSRSIANLTALMLAVSPYGIYLSQETMPYNLGFLWSLISLGCLVKTCQDLTSDRRLSRSLILLWTVSNLLGLATSFLFGLAIFAQIVCGGTMVGITKTPLGWQKGNGTKLGLFFLVTAIACLGSGWALMRSINYDLLVWLQQQPSKLIEVFNPIFHIIGVLITTINVLLVEVDSMAIVLASGILMFVFFCWLVPLLIRVFRFARHRTSYNLELSIIATFTLTIVAIYPCSLWLFGVDITRGARFHYTYFPGVVLLTGLGLGLLWKYSKELKRAVNGRIAVAIVLGMGLIGSTIVATDYGYRKYYRPEAIIPAIAKSAPYPVTIASTYHQPTQIGEIQSLVWPIYRDPKLHKQLDTMGFLLAKQTYPNCKGDSCPASQTLEQTISKQQPPVDVWLLNFNAPVKLPKYCERDREFKPQVYGYFHQLYHCRSVRDLS
jgi:uncharacterized membrane protein